MLIETAKMSERGQIIIPKAIREGVGAREDTIFTFALIGDAVVMKPLDTEKIRKDLESFQEIRRKSKKADADAITKIIHATRKDRS